MTVVLVTGGREYKDKEKIFKTLDYLHKKWNITLIVQGYARGTDKIANYWAKLRKVPTTDRKYEISPNAWIEEGYAAGPNRNQRMLDEEKIEQVVAFPGGNGTKDMIKRAEKAGLKVLKVDK